MEIRWLEDFIALARTRHFSRAADEQNVTQPTFSRRIKMLEEEMGVTLIDRNTLPLSLTPAGEIFLKSAAEISGLLKDTKSRCACAHKIQENTLKFATSQTLYLCFYQSWLKPLCDTHNVDVELNLDSTAWNAKQFVGALLQNQCDAMLCYWHPSMEDMRLADDTAATQYVTLCQEVLVPVSAADSAGKAQYVLPGRSQEPLPFIDFHEQSLLRPALQTLIEAHAQQLHLQTVNRNFHSVSVKAMVKEGFGIGWIPWRLAQESLEYGKLCLAGDSEWTLPIEVRLYWSRENTNPNLHKLKEILSERSALPAGTVKTVPNTDQNNILPHPTIHNR